jgi:tRNA(fMet)-specific endonuclease VapC
LLDTNHLSAFERGDEKLLARFRARPSHDIVWISPIVIGEVEFGLRSSPTPGDPRHQPVRAVMYTHPELFPQEMVPPTGESYGAILAEIFKRHPKTDPNHATQKHLTTLEVDINDLWLAATAMTHNLTFLTSDEIKVVRACASDVTSENWLK